LTALLPALVPQRVAKRPWIEGAQRAVGNYLPLLLMGALAAFTWWLVKNTPLLDGPTEAPVARHVPDYTMRNFEIQRISAEGQLQVQIQGQLLRHYQDDDSVEIDQVRVRALTPDGTLAVAEARQALSNADGSELQLRGDVVMRRFAPHAAEGDPPRLEVRGPYLQILSNAELMRSDQPVTIRSGTGLVKAEGFEYRHLTGQLHFTGHTQATFEVKPQR
jgi:lipopolysaccharide export system protein LptC